MSYAHGYGFLSSWAQALPVGGPFLVVSNPVNNATTVAPNAVVSFTVDSLSGIDPLLLDVVLDGQQAILGGSFLPGYAGTAMLVGSSYEVVISTHPPFTSTEIIDCVIYATDNGLLAAVCVFSFSIVLEKTSGLFADAWCEGRRVDLSWINPSGVTQVMLKRSRRSFCFFSTDPGDTIYSGAAITAFTDGVYVGPNTTTNTPLEENAFYYYTLFISYNSSPPYTWHTSSEGHVIGLSIKDYQSRFGHYLYNVGAITARMRERDGDPQRGSNRYLLRKLVDIIQCGVNLIRGFSEGLLKFRDPDEIPAGQVGIARNQLGILSAMMWDLNFPVERTFDAGVLRRVMEGLVRDVYQIKGTCPGLVNLVRIITGWTARCDQLIDPLCGVNRVFQTYDGESLIQTVGPIDITLVAGSFTAPLLTITNWDGTSAANWLSSKDYEGTFVIDAMGTFACIDETATSILTFEDPNALLRKEITGSGTNTAPNTFAINTVDLASYPWQFPSPADPPEWGINAWIGYRLMDSTGTIFDIISSATTVPGGDTVLTLSGTPTTGVFSLAKDFLGITTFAGRKPLFSATVYFGAFSLLLDYKWDRRLLKEGVKGPWSVIQSVALKNPVAYSASLADVILWVQGVTEAKGTATTVGNNFLQDTTQTWTFDQFAGANGVYYLNPNWNQDTLFRIVGNSASQITVALPAGGMDVISGANSTYFILSEENAFRYLSLRRLIHRFLPYDATGFIKFE